VPAFGRPAHGPTMLPGRGQDNAAGGSGARALARADELVSKVCSAGVLGLGGECRWTRGGYVLVPPVSDPEDSFISSKPPPGVAYVGTSQTTTFGLAGDTSSEVLHRRFGGKEVSREPGRRSTSPPVTSSEATVEMYVRLCRRDVLVEAEDVLGVVRALDLLQPVPTGPVRSLHPRGVVARQVVHVGRVGRVRSERVEGAFDPGDVGVVVFGVGPLADDDEVVARLPVWERGGRWGRG
jgi:hypothetical protein